MTESFKTQLGPVNYEIAPPKEPLEAQFLWSLGCDPYSDNISSALGYKPDSNELGVIEAIVNRNHDALPSLTNICGRSATFPFSSDNLHIPFTHIEIGGFGSTQVIKVGHAFRFGSNGGCLVETPNNVNFTESFPDVATSLVVTNNGYKELGENFSFTGAYTLKQATVKVAASLFMFEQVMRSNYPFYTPLPLAIGKYPHIVAPDGNCAYFIALRVPYQGKRTGYLNMPTSKKEIAERVIYAVRLSAVIRTMHDQLGLTHNQLVTGNYYAPPHKQGPTYLADYSTIYPLPLNYNRNIEARAREIAKLVLDIYYLVKEASVFEIDASFREKIITAFLKNYLRVDILNDSIKTISDDPNSIVLYMANIFNKYRFNPSNIGTASWIEIEKRRKMLLEILRK